MSTESVTYVDSTNSDVTEALEKLEPKLYETPTELIAPVEESNFGNHDSTTVILEDISDLKNMNELKIRKIRPRSSDYYESVEGFITDPNDFAYLGFTVFNGEYLQVEMEMPNSSELDYDLYLAEEYEGSLYPFAGSENRTFINESSGTLPEHVGWHNKTGAEQTVYIGEVLCRLKH